MRRAIQTITSNEMRGVNRTAVLDLIRTEGPISRTEIASILKISLPTSMRIVDELIQAELVISTGKKEKSGGRKRPLLAFNAEEHLVIGVDMNSDSVYGAVADLSGKILVENTVKHAMSGFEIYFQLVDVIEGLSTDANQTGKQVRGICVGAPGITYDDDGEIKWAPSLDWRRFPLKKQLEDHFQVPVSLDNDVNLAAQGEMWFGEGQEARNLVLIIVGQGIGAGIIIDGAVYRGSHLTAGEIGFLLPNLDSLNKNWEGVGAAESTAAIPGILSHATTLKKRAELDDAGSRLTLEALFAADQSGAEWAKNAFDAAMDNLAQIVAAVSVCYDPEVIVLSGEILPYADKVIEPILERLVGRIPIQPKLVPSKLGKRGSILGAVINVLHNTYDFYVVQKVT